MRVPTLIAMFLTLLSLSSMATAVSNVTQYCTPDNQTLVKQYVVYINETNTSRTFGYPYPCQYGCDPERSTCNYAPWIKYLILIGILVALFLIFKFGLIPWIQRR